MKNTTRVDFPAIAPIAVLESTAALQPTAPDETLVTPAPARAGALHDSWRQSFAFPVGFARYVRPLPVESGNLRLNPQHFFFTLACQF